MDNNTIESLRVFSHVLLHSERAVSGTCVANKPVSQSSGSRSVGDGGGEDLGFPSDLQPPPPQGPCLLGSLKKEGQCQVFLTPSSPDSRDVHRARRPTSHSQRQIRPRHAGPVGPTEGEEKP